MIICVPACIRHMCILRALRLRVCQPPWRRLGIQVLLYNIIFSGEIRTSSSTLGRQSGQREAPIGVPEPEIWRKGAPEALLIRGRTNAGWNNEVVVARGRMPPKAFAHVTQTTKGRSGCRLKAMPTRFGFSLLRLLLASQHSSKYLTMLGCRSQ